jgi:hypothetical protein
MPNEDHPEYEAWKNRAREVPYATVRELDGRGHQLDDDLSEVAHDIVRLEGGKS